MVNLVTFTDETSDGDGFQLQMICKVLWCQGNGGDGGEGVDTKHEDKDLDASRKTEATSVATSVASVDE